ncbi:MAG: isoprenylcysteine carboxylmethyltransferase family protein [Bacteroidales bacterium]|nr:isoprenylcysteine carboxylmethyltransferase family protein [Bacteroidales bacterium]
MELTEKQKIINAILTIIQYLGFAIFLYFSPWVAKGLFLQITELLGIILAIWAVVVMNKSKISIAPQPRKNATLVTNGPYAIIRHPMYTSIIIAITPLIISHWDNYRFFFLMFLYMNLILKLFFEESLLRNFFSDYDEYMKKSWRIIPKVF